MIGLPCGVNFFCYFSIFYLGQSIQHYFCMTMPKIDTIKYGSIIKRYLAIVILILISYFFMAFMFWSRSNIHPFYCFLVTNLGLPVLLGAIFIIHFVATLLIFIHFLHGYITRKYYLIALGGFEVEQRLIR